MLKLSKLMGALILAGVVQDAQDAQVVLRGGGFATEQRKLKVESRAGARAVDCNEQSRYAISNRIGTAASMLQHSAENLRGAGHTALKKTLINYR